MILGLPLNRLQAYAGPVTRAVTDPGSGQNAVQLQLFRRVFRRLTMARIVAEMVTPPEVRAGP